jgi:hypothetical protein
VAAVPGGDLEGLVEVVDREGHAVHADLVRTGGPGLDGVGVDVLEELEATAAVGGLQHGDVGVVAVEADGRVGPLTADRVAAEDGEPEVGEEGDRRLEVADGDPDVLELDGHVRTLPARRGEAAERDDVGGAPPGPEHAVAVVAVVVHHGGGPDLLGLEAYATAGTTAAARATVSSATTRSGARSLRPGRRTPPSRTPRRCGTTLT